MIDSNHVSFLEGYIHSFMYLCFPGLAFLCLFIGWVHTLVFISANLVIYQLLKYWVKNTKSAKSLIPKRESTANAIGSVVNLIVVVLVLLGQQLLYSSLAV